MKWVQLRQIETYLRFNAFPSFFEPQGRGTLENSTPQTSSTISLRNLKTVFSLWKRIMFSVDTTPEEIWIRNDHRSSDLCLRETGFQIDFRPQRRSFQILQLNFRVRLVWALCLSVELYAAISNFSSVLWARLLFSASLYKLVFLFCPSKVYWREKPENWAVLDMQREKIAPL